MQGDETDFMQFPDWQNLLIFHLDQVAFNRPLVLLGLLALVPAAVLLYMWQRHSLASAPAYLCGLLTGLRVVVLAILLLYFAQPYRRLEPPPPQRPVLAVLFDQSQSMELPAGPFDSDERLARVAAAAGYSVSEGAPDAETRKALDRIGRSKLALTALSHAAVHGPDGKQPTPLTEALSQKFDVRYFAFSSDLKQLGVNASKPDFPDPPHPGGKSTQIGDALQQLRETVGEGRLAGVVVFSDGQNTAGRSPEDVGRDCGDAVVPVPVFPVPVGPDHQLQDIAVVDVTEPGAVSVGDLATVRATIESRGFDQRVVKVQLWEGDHQVPDPSVPNGFVEKELTLTSAEQQHVDLTFKAAKAGAHYLTVKIPPQPEEPDYLQGNNAHPVFVAVSDEKLKVLYLEGLPRWDYRFLKNAMRRDNGLSGRTAKEPDVVLEAEWRRLSAQERTDALPKTLDELAEYHTIILGDVSPKLLTPDFVNLLAEAVRERGVGLVVEAGPLSMPHQFGDALDGLLPVKLRRKAPGRMPEGGGSFHVELAPEGKAGPDSTLMQLYDNDAAASENAWEQMPHFYWCAAAEQPAPGAVVLAWNPVQTSAGGKTPLIAKAFAGQGQVLFVGTDSTWLWRQNVGDRFFYKFWGQAIRAVARDETMGQKKNSIRVDQMRSVRVGDPVYVKVGAFAPDGSPRTDATLKARWQSGDDGGDIDMTADPNLKGQYLGQFTPKTAGDYRLTYSPDAGAPAETTLPVAAAPDELMRPNLDRAALKKLADSSTGKLLELDELASLDKELKAPPPAQEQKDSLELPKPNPWDAGLFAVVVAVLYSVDVGLRRLWGLS